MVIKRDWNVLKYYDFNHGQYGSLSRCLFFGFTHSWVGLFFFFFGQKACLNFIDYNIILDKHEILSWNQRTITKVTNVYIRLLWDISITPIAK